MSNLKSSLRSTATSLALVASLIGGGLGLAHAEPVKFEAVITPKADFTLEFADGSRHVVRLVQREGKTTGAGPLAGTRMLEVGMHDLPMAQGNGSGLGYLVFTTPDGDIAYLKFDWRALAAPDASGKPQFLLSGSWEVAGSTGKLKGMKGLGTLRINVLSPNERLWLFDGDLIRTAASS